MSERGEADVEGVAEGKSDGSNGAADVYLRELGSGTADSAKHGGGCV